jgi:hypothetical protein
MDASRYAWAEKWECKEEYLREMALQRDRRVVYISAPRAKKILALEADGPECSLFADSVAGFYSGDGVLGDVIGGADLTAVGNVRFGPGRVGQAFILDGMSGYLAAPSTLHYKFGYRDSSVGLYVKFASVDEEMTILDRTESASAAHIQLSKSKEGQFQIEFVTTRGGPLELVSKTTAVVNQWYHLCITKSDDELAFYVNGVLEDRKPIGDERAAGTSTAAPSLYLGATKDGLHLFHGKLDEVLFYNRALTADEVRRLYELRESGKCRI